MSHKRQVIHTFRKPQLYPVHKGTKFLQVQFSMTDSVKKWEEKTFYISDDVCMHTEAYTQISNFVGLQSTTGFRFSIALDQHSSRLNLDT